MIPKYRVGTVIVCDDVRSESSGKETLVGVYNGVLVVPSLPTSLPKLCFRLPIIADGPLTAKVTFRVVSPSGAKMIEIFGEANVKPSDPGHEVPFGFAVGNISFPESGEYEIYFALGDAKPKRVAIFIVRQPRLGEPTYVPPASPTPLPRVKSKPKKSNKVAKTKRGAR